MAVYYATTQQRNMGRLLDAKDIRLWIRGGVEVESSWVIPSFEEVFQYIHEHGNHPDHGSHQIIKVFQR